MDFVVTMYRDVTGRCNLPGTAKEQVLVALPADHPANAYAYQEDGDDYLHLDMIHLDRETFILPMMARVCGKQRRGFLSRTISGPEESWR